MIEEYKKLREYPRYRIYNTGKIYSEHYKKFIHQHDDNSGYLQVTLVGIHGRKTIKSHILVAKAFLPNPNNMKVRNLGRKSLEEVLAKLEELGLSLSKGEE